MQKIAPVLAILFFILPSVSSAAALTQQQSNSLIAVVQSSPGTPASAFVSLITAFSNITVNQATSLITVVQAAPGVPANAFVNLLTSFTVDTVATQAITPVVASSATTQPTQTTQPVIPIVTTQPQTTQSAIQTPVATNPQPTAAVPAVSTQTNSPSVDIKVQGSDGPVTTPVGGPLLTVSWTSQNVISCSVSNPGTGKLNVPLSGSSWQSTSGSNPVGFSAATTVVSIQCSALVNNVVVANAVSDSVTVNVPGGTVYVDRYGTSTATESLSVMSAPSDEAHGIAGDPVSGNIPAGGYGSVGEFKFTSKDSSYIIKNLSILVPTNVANSVSAISIQYSTNGAGNNTQSQNLVIVPGDTYARATFTGLDMFVPANDSAYLPVMLATQTITGGATLGAGINVSLDTGATTYSFQAADAIGKATRQINGGTPVASAGTHYVMQ